MTVILESVIEENTSSVEKSYEQGIRDNSNYNEMIDILREQGSATRALLPIARLLRISSKERKFNKDLKEYCKETFGKEYTLNYLIKKHRITRRYNCPKDSLQKPPLEPPRARNRGAQSQPRNGWSGGNH